ncbi:MAG: DUF1552 domain-containing protein [Myxococcota bacterium]|nr:DUF1552 domain-containing protein [Myxococcota bacterium]
MISRRGLFVGTGAAALLSRIASSEPRRAPLRILLVHKPAGTVPENYDAASIDALSPILAPFADLRQHMVVVDGLENRKQSNTPGEEHANGMTTFLTGGIPFKPNGSSISMMARATIDQVLAQNSRVTGSAPIRSLQLTADDRGHQFILRAISSAGRGMPLPPEESPLAAFARVFGPLSTGRSPAQQQSILDFTRDDLARLQPQLPRGDRERLDRHLTAIREVEQVMYRVAVVDPLPVQRQMRAATLALNESRDHAHAQIGRAHLDLVRIAFQCDLTRIATFTWGSWATNVSSYVPGVAGRTHHELSHAGLVADETAVHRWYNEQLAAYLRTLRYTPDVDGRTLLDNTLVVSWTEMQTGSHTFDNVPVQLFGGAGGRLAGGRLVRHPGYSTNDLWRSLLNAVGDGREVFGDADKNSGRLAGLFADSPLDDFTLVSRKPSR